MVEAGGDDAGEDHQARVVESEADRADGLRHPRAEEIPSEEKIEELRRDTEQIQKSSEQFQTRIEDRLTEIMDMVRNLEKPKDIKR